jgi:hypothetical protein
MSLTTDRAAIVAALSAVAGITGYNAPPSVLSAGDALVQLASLDSGPAFGLFQKSWVVHVLLSDTLTDALALFEAKALVLADALQPVAYVASIAPVVYESAGAKFAAIEIRLIRE